MKKIAFSIVLFLCISAIYSQDKQFNLGAELRPRMLIDNGYRNPKASDDKTLSFITQRTRLNIGYQKDILETYISIQDIRIWGDDNNYKESGALGNTESISLHQAWFLFKPTQTLSVKTGRQLFQYDDQRILSSRNWNDYQVTYDAVLLQFNDAINKFDIGLTWNSETSKSYMYPDEKFKVFDFIRYERQLKHLNISILGILAGNTISDTTETIYLRGTYGVNLKYH